MNRSNNPRRQFVKNTAAAIGMVTLPFLIDAKVTKPLTKRKIVCVGAHPDDPESGCGGTLAKLAKAGHDVTIIYLTTGEAGIAGTGHNDAARIRKQEAINACKLLNVKPVFAGQIDGDTIVTNLALKIIQDLIETEKPDVVCSGQ